MSYVISDKVQGALQKLTGDAQVQKALKFIEDDQEFIIQKQCELTLIPAPTFHEEKKAKRLMELFREAGLADVHIDDYGNVCGVRKGTGGGKNVLIEGHMDTVFAEDTPLEIRRENGYIHCPGICDDTRGCVNVLSVLRAMNQCGIQTKGDVHFVGTVQEEGMGALLGMQYYVQHHPELQASISCDGDGYKEITYEATGIQTYVVTFHGIGGHAYGMFGKVANPLHAAGRAIAKIAELEVPESPRTTFAVTGAEAGSPSAIHAIVKDAVIRLNFRSNSHEELVRLHDAIFRCIDEACKEETARWGKDTITYTCEHVMDVDAGNQDPHAPIVEGAMAASQYLSGEEAKLGEGGSTNCNRALEAGLPAVCLGMNSEYDSKCHTLEEQFREKDAFKLPQMALLLILMCAGSEKGDSILD